jgi:hypothetical protein
MTAWLHTIRSTRWLRKTRPPLQFHGPQADEDPLDLETEGLRVMGAQRLQIASRGNAFPALRVIADGGVGIDIVLGLIFPQRRGPMGDTGGAARI